MKNNLLPLFRTAAVLVCLTCFFHGCGKPKVKGLVPAEGVLLYEGIPLPWAAISCTPKDAAAGTRSASALSDEKGRFSLKTLGQQGALPGEYDVNIRKYVPDQGKGTLKEWKKSRETPGFTEPPPKEDTSKVVSVIPEKFSKPGNSSLSVTVESKGNRDIKLEFGN